MQTFSPGDRVVAIDLRQGPLKTLSSTDAHPFLLPDGPLRTGTVYHIASVCRIRDGSQGIYLTGLRVLWGPQEVPWNPGRFRKVENHRLTGSLKHHHKQPAATALCAVS